ncbi:class I SAM-dependent methyltransferase [Phenylobacterium sp. VNQ135]|uniref:class I SAM-dependent methyltransferase n=1 Tax=Phenylobacterium sp. VNQ135 TaxID=3400922 RepID=UPI003C09811C
MRRGPLKRALRRVLEVTGLISVVYRAAERRLARVPVKAFDDGRPMPPPELRVAVTGDVQPEWFSRTGETQARDFTRMAGEHGMRFEDGIHVLDFGCGSGRIARWLAPEVTRPGGRFTGTDLNPKLAAWCAENLPGRYVSNGLKPPLALPDGEIDLLYAYSVFTHLREPLARAWLAELARVLKPGGLALVTFHDEAFTEICGPPEAKAGLAASPYFVLNDAMEGSNYLSAWTTRARFAELAQPHFRAEAIHLGQKDIQATAVLRRLA